MGVSDSLTKLFQSFLANRFQRVLLNDHTLEWLAVKASVPQGSVLRPLFFVIYINDLSKNIESTVKLFIDDTSLFSVAHDNNTSAKVLNMNLQKISEWVHKWKISFSPDVSKQAQRLYSQGDKPNQCTQILSLIIRQFTKLTAKTFRSIFRHEVKM